MLPQCKHCSAKMLLATYMPPLRITIRGKFPPDHPLFRFQGRLKCDDFFTHAFALSKKTCPRRPKPFTAG